MIVFLQILLYDAQAQCQIKSDGGPTQLYPTLGSPMILDLGQYINGSNLKFSYQGGQSATIYQTTIGPELNIYLNGTVISSCPQQNNLQLNDPKFGIFAFLTKNSSGYYVYQLEITDTSIQVQQVGDAIQGINYSLLKVPFYINCFSLTYQQQGLFVSCIGFNNQPVIYQYDLNENPSLTISYPVPQQINFTLGIEGIQNSYILQYNYNSIVLGYSSTLNNQSTVAYVQLVNNTQQINSTQYNSQLNGLWVQQEIGIGFLLFKNLLVVEQYPNYTVNYSYPGLQFLDFSIQCNYFQYSQDQFNLFITVATQESILLLQYDLSLYNVNFIGQIAYPSNFNATVDSNMQLFTDELFIIVSNGQKVIIYEIANPNQIFWNYSLGGQYNLQYDTTNQILIIIQQQTVYTYQLFVPKLIMQFNTIVQGQLTITGSSQQTCSTQLNYSVILGNNTQPLPNYLNQNYTMNYPSQLIQGLSSLFVGQNLSFNISSSNSNTQIVSMDINDFLKGQNFNYINAFLNPFNINQYMIVYQLQNSNALQVIYCSLQYCKQKLPTQFLPGFFNLTSQLQSLTLGGNFYDLSYTSLHKQLLEIVIIVNSSTITPTYYNCLFEWFDAYPDCAMIERFPYLPPPNSYLQQVVYSGLNFYVVMSNPSALLLLEGGYISQQYQTRCAYTNIQDYTNLVFLDNIYELSIQQAPMFTQITSIQYPIQQGNTSVGVGLLRQGIFIAQIDNQGNQYILYYDNIILTQTNFLQTIQPQQVQIPSGVVIQFPIISTFTSNKFYLVWNFKGQNQIAVLQSSSDINSMLYQSIYVSYQISSLNAVSIADYDQLFCMSNTGLVQQYFIINKFQIKIIPENLLSEIYCDLQVNITAYNSYSNSTQNLNYTVTNQMFDLKTTNDYLPIINLTFSDANQFQFNPQNYYNGLVNSYQGYNHNNSLNNVQGPISQLNGIIKIQPKPQAFYTLDYSYVIFQNNLNLYIIDNVQIGSYKIINQFIGMVNCPILYAYDDTIYSICQDNNYNTFQYVYEVSISFEMTFFLYRSNGYILGGGYLYEDVYYLNYGQLVVFYGQNEYTCSYQNNNIDSSKQMVAIYHQYSIIYAFQLVDSQNILIVKNCLAENIIRLGPIFSGKITSFSLKVIDQEVEYALVVLSDQLGIIYYFNLYNNILNIVSYQLINDNINMNGVSCSFMWDHLISIYQISPLNYSVVVYEFNPENYLVQQQLPIMAFYTFYQQGISNFYYSQYDQILFVVDTGFSYLQFQPYITVGINNDQLKSTFVSSNNTYEVTSSVMDLVIKNPFYSLNVSLNLTLTQYQGEQIAVKQFFSTTQFLTLLIVSIVAIAGFFSFACMKIFRKQQWE